MGIRALVLLLSVTASTSWAKEGGGSWFMTKYGSGEPCVLTSQKCNDIKCNPVPETLLKIQPKCKAVNDEKEAMGVMGVDCLEANDTMFVYGKSKEKCEGFSKFVAARKEPPSKAKGMWIINHRTQECVPAKGLTPVTAMEGSKEDCVVKINWQPGVTLLTCGPANMLFATSIQACKRVLSLPLQ